MTDLILFLKDNLAEHFVIYFIPPLLLGGAPHCIDQRPVAGSQDLISSAGCRAPGHTSDTHFLSPLREHLQKFLHTEVIRKKKKNPGHQAKSPPSSNGFRPWGRPVVVIITALPLKGCGILSGFILSKFLKISKPRVYLLLILGSILGCGILFGLGEILLKSWELLINKV